MLFRLKTANSLEENYTYTDDITSLAKLLRFAENMSPYPIIIDVNTYDGTPEIVVYDDPNILITYANMINELEANESDCLR